MRPFDGRKVLLVVSGGIAAYKSAFLARRLVEAGAGVDVILTRGAERFVGSVTFEGITGRRVHTDLWERPMAHLELGRAADAVVVAPATADLIARLAAGAADGLAAATLLACDRPVIVCPAMNTRMWEHAATTRNVETLRGFGHEIVGPDDGPLAEGETGPGRMAEPAEILARLGRMLEPDAGLRGLKVVVTAGPTRAPLDPVRFLSNRSSGRMGYALAAAAWRRGADAVLVSGPGHAPRPLGPRVIEVETASEMLAALESELRGARILLMAAAVGDFEAGTVEEHKIKRSEEGGLELELEPAPDLLVETRALRERNGIFTLGFALETETEKAIDNGRAKLDRKGLDLIAVNVAGEPDSGFDVETNRVTLLDAAGDTESLPLLRKDELADRLLDRIEESLGT